MKNNFHSGHRERVRKRFIKEGNLDSFEQHQILELLLFYAIPRRDTNEIAHKILKEYGNLHSLMNARPEDIMKKCKVSEATAVLISSIPHIARRFLNSAWQGNKIKLDNFEEASAYLESLLYGIPFECFYMLSLDTHKNLKKATKVSDGNANSTPVYIDKIVGEALLHNASYVIVGHNHPGGSMRPSSNDIEITHKIINAFEPLGITVLDHIIVCGIGNYSFAQNSLCHMKY